MRRRGKSSWMRRGQPTARSGLRFAKVCMCVHASMRPCFGTSKRLTSSPDNDFYPLEHFCVFLSVPVKQIYVLKHLHTSHPYDRQAR